MSEYVLDKNNLREASFSSLTQPDNILAGEVLLGEPEKPGADAFLHSLKKKNKNAYKQLHVYLKPQWKSGAKQEKFDDYILQYIDNNLKMRYLAKDVKFKDQKASINMAGDLVFFSGEAEPSQVCEKKRKNGDIYYTVGDDGPEVSYTLLIPKYGYLDRTRGGN